MICILDKYGLTGFRNDITFRYSRVLIVELTVQGFRMLYCSGGFIICFIVKRFRMFYCSWVQNV